MKAACIAVATPVRLIHSCWSSLGPVG